MNYYSFVIYYKKILNTVSQSALDSQKDNNVRSVFSLTTFYKLFMNKLHNSEVNKLTFQHYTNETNGLIDY